VLALLATHSLEEIHSLIELKKGCETFIPKLTKTMIAIVFGHTLHDNLSTFLRGHRESIPDNTGFQPPATAHYEDALTAFRAGVNNDHIKEFSPCRTPVRRCTCYDIKIIDNKYHERRSLWL
jgi:hypothetical protein